MKHRVSTFLVRACVVVGGTIYLAVLRLLKAVRQHDVALIRKFLGTRLSFVSKILGAVLVAK